MDRRETKGQAIALLGEVRIRRRVFLDALKIFAGGLRFDGRLLHNVALAAHLTSQTNGTSSTMATCKEIGEKILQGDLMSADELAAKIAEFQRQAGGDDGDALVRWLADAQLLTDFQADALSSGLVGPFLLGPYRVEGHLTAGRLGHVFRGRHVEFDLPVSLKVFPASVAADPEKMARMTREARVVLQLDHPNLIRTFQIGRFGQIHYLAMEDLPRESLLARLERSGRLRHAEACRLIRQAALGLEYLHQNEIILRDVSPANMWITPDERLKLVEFGAARDSLAFLDAPDDGQANLTLEGTQLGTNEYMSPEQAADPRNADARSDLYSLGCTLYHALSGRPPFVDKNPMKLLMAHASATPQRVDLLSPEIPHELADVVDRLLAKSPEGRMQTAAEVDWALQPFIGAGSVEADTATAEWNPEYLAWVNSMNAEVFNETESETAPSELAPDAAEFLDWLSERFLGK